jgi:hypothetical protein
MSGGLASLQAMIRAEGGLLATAVGDEPAPAAGRPDHAAAAATGPRVAAYRDEVEVAVAAVREGYELHYGSPRALSIDDPDLALLAGDRLYALGLERLAAAGDLPAIAALADIISRSAQAHAQEDPGLADAAWDAGTTAISTGRASSDG